MLVWTHLQKLLFKICTYAESRIEQLAFTKQLKNPTINVGFSEHIFALNTMFILFIKMLKNKSMFSKLLAFLTFIIIGSA